MTSLFKFFISNWRFSFLLTFIIVIMGSIGLFTLQREAFPPVNFATLTVSTVYPGASPEEVYDKVSRIIESELRGTSGIKDVKSVSQSGLSTVTIRVDIDRDDSKEIVNEVQRAVTRASSQLPAEILEAPLVTELKAKEIPILEVALVGENSSRKRDLSAEILKEKLEDIRGVSSVRYSGYLEREIQILLNKEKLSEYNVGIVEVVNALRARLKNIPAGSLESSEKTTLVRLIGQSSRVEEISNLVLRSNDAGVIVRVKQIAKVIDSHKKPKIMTRVNGEPATLLIITKKEDADAISVVEKIETEINSYKQSLDPKLNLIVYNNEGERIKNRLDIVEFNTLFGLAAVLLVLFLFLPGKVGLWSSASLPICALGTVGLMVYLGANFNIITMIAIVICLGNLVDNSVVVSEYYSTLREKGIEAQEAAIQSAAQFWIPFTASTITIIAAFLPMLVTQGVLGQFIRWIPIVVTIALTLSLIEALTLLPARLQFINPKSNKKSSEIQNSSKVQIWFGQIVEKTLINKYKSAFLMTVLIISGFVITATLNRFELFPAEGVEYYVARFESEPQTTIYKTDQAAGKLSALVSEKLGKNVVDTIISRSGIQQVGGGDPLSKSGDNVGFLLIKIKKEIYMSLNIEDTLKKLRTIKSVDGLRKLSFSNIQGGPPVGAPVTVTLRSNNDKLLAEKANAFVSELSKVPGVNNVESDQIETGSEYLFKPKDDYLALVGINLDSIGNNIRAAIEGLSVTQLTSKGIEFDVTVKYEESDKDDLQDLKNTKISNSLRNLTPVSMVGSIEKSQAPPIIKGYDFKRSVTISADIDQSKTSSVVANSEARKIINNLLSDTSEVSTVFGGVDESTKESLRSLRFALILAILGIFASLVFTFNSFSKPFIILSSIPLGLVGVLYSFALVQRPLSFLAFIGVIGLSGVVINSAIILVDFIEELKRDNPNMNLKDILVQASKQRLRAVLATGLTTVVGLLPTAFGIGGEDPLLIPITFALSWGMIIGTVLSLIWIPSAYLILEDFKSFLKVKLGINIESN